MNRSTLVGVLLAALGAACADQPLPVGPQGRPTQVASAGPTCDPGLASTIRTEITTLFGKSGGQSALSQFRNIERTCPDAESQSKAIEFVQYTAEKFQEGQLTSAATTATAAQLLNDVLTFVGLSAGIPGGALGPQGVIAEVLPSTDVQVLSTGDGRAGVSLPAGAVSQPVILAIAPTADQTDPLPGANGLPHFPPFYDFVVSPAVPFVLPVTIGICVSYGSASQGVLDRLQLARPDPAVGGATLEVLPRVAAPFLPCPSLPGLAAAAPPAPADGGGFFQRLLGAGVALLRPATLHAAPLLFLQTETTGALGAQVTTGGAATGAVDPVCANLTEIQQGYCTALVALYEATDGPNWTSHTNWLENDDFCSWYGVSCVKGIPFELTLGYNNLSGELPSEIGNLDSLRNLYLYGNHLNGVIPVTVGKLEYLEEWIANGNQLSGAIPSELGSLKSLRWLFLNSNELSGPIPEQLGDLGKLEILALNENQLSDTIPTRLGNLANLVNLRLQLNQLTGLVPLPVAQLGGRLESADPNSCSLTPANSLRMGDSNAYRDADSDGDGLICGVAVPRGVTKLQALSGDGQVGLVGSVLAPIVVLSSDDNGLPVSHVTVTFAVTGGGGTVANATVRTGDDGLASTTWTLGTSAGANTVTATVAGLPAVTFTATGTVPTHLQAVSGDGQTGIVGTALAQPLVVNVFDDARMPLAGIPVTFTVVEGGGSLGTPTVVSDANGVASTTWTLGPTAGTNTVRASAVGTFEQLSFTADGEPAGPHKIVVVSGDGQSGLVNTTLASPVVAEVVDAGGAPVSGVSVSFTAPAGAGTFAPGVVVTDGAGLASTTWTLGPVPGLSQAQASVAGLTAAGFSALAFPRLVVESGDNQTGAVGAPLPNPVVIQVQDGNGNGVTLPSPMAVGFAVVAGGGSVSPAQSPTDGQGRASATWVLGTTPGTNSLQATLVNLPQGSFDLVPPTVTATATGVSAGAAANLVIVSGNDQTGATGATLSQPLVVQVSDAGGLPVSGVAVDFTVTGGGGSVSATPVVTDPYGNASVSWTLGQSGLNTLQASAAGLTPVEFSSTAVAPAQIAFLDAPRMDPTVGTQLPLQAQVTDASGNPLGGVSVTFSITAGNGTVQPGQGVTDANRGVAQATLTVGTTAGVNTVEATVSGISPAVLSVTGAPGPLAQLEKVSGDLQSAIHGTTLPADIVVRAADAYGNGLAGVPVAFEVTGGGGTVGNPAATSDLQGLAATSWTLGSNTGPNEVTATVAGAAVVIFTATSLVGPAAVVTTFSGDNQDGNTNYPLKDPLVVVVSDADGNPVSGAAVTFTVTSGDGSVGTPSATTDQNGAATTAWTLGPLSGTQTVEAGVSGLTPVIFTAQAFAPRVTVVSGDNQTGVAGTQLADPIVVKALDVFGAALSGVTIDFVVASGGGTVGTAEAVTGSDGLASTTWTLGPVVGANELYIEGPEGTLTVGATGVAGPASAFTVVSGGGQSAQAGTTLFSQVVIRVTDSNGNPVTGAPVTLTTPNEGSIFPASPTTDAQGLVSFQWTLGPSVIGSQIVTVVVADLTLQPVVTATATTLAGPALAIAGGNNQSGTTGAQLSLPIMARVLDGSGTPVAGVEVTFTVVAGEGSVGSGTAVTDANGIARTSWVLGAAGPNTVRASTTQAGTLPVYFSATAF